MTLIGLSLHGLGTGHIGIFVQQVGFLRLYSVTIENFYDGVYVESAGNLAVYDSRFNDSGNAGLQVNNASASAYVHNSGFDHNSQAGVLVTAGTVTAADSYAHYSFIGFASDGGTVVLIRDHAIFNQIGAGALTNTSVMQFSYCLITRNTVNSLFIDPGATVSESNPGTSVVIGTIGGGGSLSAATALQ